jgi:alkylation response protein AidB-like acyl-CoA dehydrogenase
MVLEVTDGAVQVLGGHGYIREHPGRAVAAQWARLCNLTMG